MSFALAAISLLGVLIGATLQYSFNRNIEARKLLLTQKALAYTDYFKAVAGIAQQRTTERLALAADAKTRICLFGTPYVIQSLAELERAGNDSSSPEAQQILLSLLEHMRQDLVGSRRLRSDANFSAVLFGSGISRTDDSVE